MTPDEEHTLISNVGQLLTVVENLRSLSPETQKELAADVRKTREDVATISASCLPCQKLIFTHDQVLNGNARPGLVARTMLLEDDAQRRKALEVRYTRWAQAQLGSIVAALVAFLGMAAAYFFER